MKLDIAYAPSASTTFWQRGETTWDEVCSWPLHPRTDGTKDGPGYVLGKLSSPRRSRDTVVSRSVLALDADHLTPASMDQLLMRLRALGCAAMVYSTFSSTAEAPRLRILVLPSRALSPDEYWAVAHWLMTVLGYDLFDKGSPQHERLMYMPSVAPGGAFYHEVMQGPPLDVAMALSAAELTIDVPERDAGPDVLDLPDRVVPARAVPEQIISDQVRSALRGLDSIAGLPEGGRLEWPGVPGGLGWDLGTLFMAERLIEAANSGGSYTIRMAQEDFLEHAPESAGTYDRAHKWRQAVKWVGSKPIPYMGAADVFDALPAEASPAAEPVVVAGTVLTPGAAVALQRLRDQDAAREAYRREKEPPAAPRDSGFLRTVLQRPERPTMRVEGLIPWASSTLMSAMRKTGKTTLNLNLAQCLLTGRPFLGRYAVKPIDGVVAMMNFEVDGLQIARWADEHSVDPDRFYLVNLRGQRNPLIHPADRASLAAELRAVGVESLIVDPFGRAFTGTEQNDAGPVGAFLQDLDAFARTEVGAVDLILTAHAGWQGERTRGSSALEDWPDSIITMTRGAEEESDQRFISAMGRDVDVPEDRLVYDTETRTLSLAGTGGRKVGKSETGGTDDPEIRASIVEALKDGPLSGTEIGVAVNQRGASLSASREGLVTDGLVVKTPRAGRGGGYLYSLVFTEPTCDELP